MIEPANRQPDPIAIRHLVDVPGALPILARWFVDEWEPYYGPSGPGDAEADLRAAGHRDRLPVCLVALDQAGAARGTIALKTESVASHRHLSPWVAAFLVAPEFRRRGIGTALITAVENEARGLGYKRIYVAADESASLLERRGWRAFDEASTLRGSVKVYRLEL